MVGTRAAGIGADPGRRMRVLATIMLAAMAAIFIAAARLEDVHPAWGFVKAFAEAAMVGGIADWFAVTALFRHPLGIPIPHTAIIPKNKDRIGDTMAAFLRTNFLTPRVVARRMQRVDVGGAIGGFLLAPPQQGRLWRGAARMVESVLEALGPERFGAIAKTALADRLRSFNAAPVIGEAMDAAIAEDRHVPLLDEMVIWIARLVRTNEDLIRSMVHDRSGGFMRFTGLDAPLAGRIIDAIDKLLSELAMDPNHPLRAKIEESLRDLARKLRDDPATQARVQQMKADLLANPAVEQWWLGMWERARAGMLRAVRDPDSALAGEMGALLRQFGEALQDNPKFRFGINRFVRRAAVGVAADYGDGIVKLVSDTVRRWDAKTISDRVENAVGRDLQFIRINGTVVGGLVGLTIHTVEVLAQ